MKKEQVPFFIIRNWRSSDSPISVSQIKKRKPSTHSWNDQQHMSYLKFFEKNYHIASDQASRKYHRIFVKMTEYIPTRSSAQIKSHHQKLMTRFRSLENILRELSLYLQSQRQESQFQQVSLQNSKSSQQQPEIKEESSLSPQTDQEIKHQSFSRTGQQIASSDEEQKLFSVLEGFSNCKIQKDQDS